MRRKIASVLVFIMLFLGCTMEMEYKQISSEDYQGNHTYLAAKAADTQKKKQVTLTKELLTGTWVNENGYVCGYADGYFSDHLGNGYIDCSITKNGVTGTYTRYEETEVNIAIRMYEDDSIEVDGVKAVRADSEQGKKYIEDVKKRIIGTWLLSVEDMIYPVEYVIGDNTIQCKYTSDGDDAVATIDYKYENAFIIMYDKENEEMDQDYVSISFDGEKLVLGSYLSPVYLVKKDSEKYKDYISGKAYFYGEWLYTNAKEDRIENWKFDKKGKVTITSYKKNVKKKVYTYKTKLKEDRIELTINKQTYLCSVYEKDIVLRDKKNNMYYLYGNKTSEGKRLLNKAKVIYKNGKIEKRSYNKNVRNDDVVTDIKIKLTCKNNSYLSDDIIIDPSNEVQRMFVSDCYFVSSKVGYKNATLTMTYNDKNLLYKNSEKDIVVAYMPSSNNYSDGVILKGKLDTKKNTITVPLRRPGYYVLIDGGINKGASRKLKDINQKALPWVKNNDTGDILKLIDLDYIEQSKGNFNVSTPSQLASAVYYANTISSQANISLEKDIDLSGYKWVPMGWCNYNYSIYESFSFCGTLLGNGHKIKGLTIDITEGQAAFIGSEQDAIIKDLTIEGADIRGSYNVAILTAESSGGSYDNCHVSGKVTSTYDECIGTLIALTEFTTINKCTADVLVNGGEFPYLTWNEREIAQIVVENPITITVSDNGTVTRQANSGYVDLNWVIEHNGEVIYQQSAVDQLGLQYWYKEPGTYEIYLQSYLYGQYIPVSNKVTYTVH